MEPGRTFIKKAKIKFLSNYSPILVGYLNKINCKNASKQTIAKNLKVPTRN